MQTKEIIFLTKDEVKEIERIVEKNYGAKFSLKEFAVAKGKEEKIWISSKEIFDFNLSKLNVNSFGLNFGKLKRNDKIHLTIEGSQMVGKLATKNLVVLDEENAIKFMQGLDVKPKEEVNCEYHNFVIVKYKDKILGSSLLTEQGLKNMTPKSRRIPLIL
jgi:NOL1/NOP2/fmu family ribosome biogenesis protein